MKTKTSLAVALAAIALVAVACGTGDGSTGPVTDRPAPSAATAAPSASPTRSPTPQPPERPDGVRLAVPPWSFDCPSAAEVTRSWDTRPDRRKLLWCSRLRMPITVEDDLVTMSEGTEVVFLGVVVRSDQDYVVVALPRGYDETYRRRNGGTARRYCPDWSAHMSPASNWGLVFAHLGWPPPAEPHIPRGRFGCRIDLEEGTSS